MRTAYLGSIPLMQPSTTVRDVARVSDLVAWRRSRDEAAFARLVEQHSGLVAAACRRQLDSTADADEATQAVFLILARRAGDVQDPERLSAWLYGTAINVCRNARRAATSRQQHEREASRLVTQPQPDTDGSESDWTTLRRHLDAALASLNDGQRDAVVGHFLEGLSQAAVAMRLGISEEAAKKRIHYATDKLRAWFGKRGMTVTAIALSAGLTSEVMATEPTLIASCVTNALQPTLAPTGVTTLAGDVHRSTSMLAMILVCIVAAILTGGVVLWQRTSLPAGESLPATAAVVASTSDSPPPPPKETGSLKAAIVVSGTDNWSPVFSPDGNSLVYLNYDAANSMVRLGLVELDPKKKTWSEPKIIADIGSAKEDKLASRSGDVVMPMLLWAADGKTLYALRQGGKNIMECVSYAVPAGTSTVLGSVSLPAKYGPVQFQWGPGGKLAATLSLIDLTLSDQAKAEPQPLVLFDPTGAAVERSSRSWHRLFALPDGKIFVGVTKTEACTLDAAAAPVETLITAKEPFLVQQLLVSGKETLFAIAADKHDDQYEAWRTWQRPVKGVLQTVFTAPIGGSLAAALNDGKFLWAEYTQPTVNNDGPYNGPPVTVNGKKSRLFSRGERSFVGLQVMAIDKQGKAAVQQQVQLPGIKMDVITNVVMSPTGTKAIIVYSPVPTDMKLGMISSRAELAAFPKMPRGLIVLNCGKGGVVTVAGVPDIGDGRVFFGYPEPPLAWSPDGRAVAITCNPTITAKVAQGIDKLGFEMLHGAFVARGSIRVITF